MKNLEVFPEAKELCWPVCGQELKISQEHFSLKGSVIGWMLYESTDGLNPFRNEAFIRKMSNIAHTAGTDANRCWKHNFSLHFSQMLVLAAYMGKYPKPLKSMISFWVVLVWFLKFTIRLKLRSIGIKCCLYSRAMKFTWTAEGLQFHLCSKKSLIWSLWRREKNQRSDLVERCQRQNVV